MRTTDDGRDILIGNRIIPGVVVRGAVMWVLAVAFCVWWSPPALPAFIVALMAYWTGMLDTWRHVTR